MKMMRQLLCFFALLAALPAGLQLVPVDQKVPAGQAESQAPVVVRTGTVVVADAEEEEEEVADVSVTTGPNIRVASGLDNPVLLEALRQYNKDPATIPAATHDPDRQARLKELREVMEEVYASQPMDETVVLKELLERVEADLNTIAGEGAALAELREGLVYDLEAMQEIVYHIDKAVDFCKVGGIANHLRLYKVPDPEIRGYAAWNLGVAGSNNPAAQHYLHAEGVIQETLAEIAKAGPEDQMFVLRGIYALSALTRQNATGIDLLRAADGPNVLLDAVERLGRPAVTHKHLRLVADTVALSPEDAPYSGSRTCKFVQDTMVGLEVDPDMNFNVVRDVVQYLRHTGTLCPVRGDTYQVLQQLAAFRAEFDRDTFDDLTLLLRRGPTSNHDEL